MKLHKVFAGLLICFLLLGLTTSVNAYDPPPPKGSFAPVPIQEAHFVLDPATASVTLMEPAEDGESLVPASPPAEAPAPIIKGNDDPFAPGPVMLAEFDGETLKVIPDSANIANDLSIVIPAQSGLSSQEISTASSSQIVFENFEGTFPTGNWYHASATGHIWDDVDCFPIESTGTSSAWPAYNLSVPDPCSSGYVNNMDSWLYYGPFSLSDARSAYLDFYYRLESESFYDHLRWGASINGTNFFGQEISGTYISGPFNNGYNFVSFDLADVFTLGDLTGEPQVWIAFEFSSDPSITDRGPFIDYVSLRKNSVARKYITQEDFDVVQFPNESWLGFDNDGLLYGEYYWDDVGLVDGPNCPPRSGNWSMWPADDPFIGGLDPCKSPPDDYANYMWSWLVYGPFSLAGASEAWVDFYYRNVSETCCDYLWWMASKNGTNFFGYGTSGTHIGGPHRNGYNLRRFDLSNVWSVGDLRGESTVWLAFIFDSDYSITAQGPFIDDVSVAVETNAVYLPSLVKSEAPPGGALTFENYTGNPVVVELIGFATRTFPDTVGPHVWDNIPPGTYDWLASGTCPAGQGQVGSAPPASNRAPITIIANQTTILNQENGGQFDCEG